MKPNYLKNILLLIISVSTITFFSCGKEEVDNTLSFDKQSYFMAMIDENTLQYQVSSTIREDSEVDINKKVGLTERIYTNSFVDIVNGDSVTVVIGTMATHGTYVSLDQINDFFGVDDVPYSVNAREGIELNWYDKNGELWSTSLGSGDQTLHKFSIINMNSKKNTVGYDIIIEAEFSCVLYNKSGKSITLHNGSYIGKFIDIIP